MSRLPRSLMDEIMFAEQELLHARVSNSTEEQIIVLSNAIQRLKDAVAWLETSVQSTQRAQTQDEGNNLGFRNEDSTKFTPEAIHRSLITGVEE